MNINTETKINTSANMDVSSETKNKQEETESTEAFSSLLDVNNSLSNVIDELGVTSMLSIYEMPFAMSSSIDLMGGIQGIKSSFSFDTRTISKEDAEFFGDLFGAKDIDFVPNPQKAFINIVNEVEQTEKVHEVSKTVLNLIENAHKTNQPVRLDFDNNISVILRVDRQGKLTAEFLPSDAAAEQYLRNNIAFLRQNLDSQNIDYNDIYYRSRKENENPNQRQKQKKGDNNE